MTLKQTNERMWRRYGLYGLTLLTDFPFKTNLSDGEQTSDITFTDTAERPLSLAKSHALIYASPQLIDEKQSFLYVYQHPNAAVMRFTEVVDFYISPDEILYHLLDPAYAYMVELHLLGFVLSYWLEPRGIPVLHASAVAMDGRAVGFLSSNKGGKTSLAASLMQLGYPLLTDDILPLARQKQTYLGRPGYPQMRMWPELAQHFLNQSEALEQVHPKLPKRRVPVGADGFGAFHNAAQPLACLYLPERREGGSVEMSPLSLGQAVVELVRHSFLSGIVEAAGLQADRFRFFASLAQRVPVKRLVYPSGLNHLPEVRDAILRDLAESRQGYT